MALPLSLVLRLVTALIKPLSLGLLALVSYMRGKKAMAKEVTLKTTEKELANEREARKINEDVRNMSDAELDASVYLGEDDNK